MTNSASLFKINAFSTFIFTKIQKFDDINTVKRKPAYSFVADGTVSAINLQKAITFKTQNALDPTTLLLGIYPIDTFPCTQNNMHKDTRYSNVCANWTPLSISRDQFIKKHYIYIELYAAI